MPWNECKPMDERLRFVARLLEGEKMAPLCREFGISRVTGYKIFDRYKECGLDGLNDRSKAALPPGQQATVSGRAGDPRHQEGVPVLGRAEDPRQADPRIPDDPATRDQHHPRRARPPRPRQAPQAPPLQGLRHPTDRRPRAQRPLVRRLQGRVPARQSPVLLPAHHHRLSLALPARLRRPGVAPKSKFAFSVFERAFSDFGLPAAIRTDNGLPFAAAMGAVRAFPSSPSGGCA